MTQKDTILHALQEGDWITPLDAMNRWGIGRLAARINELKEDGHDIESKMVTVPNRVGKKCRVAEYSLKLPAQLELDL